MNSLSPTPDSTRSSPTWSDAARSVWGKTGDNDTWLPLVTHLEDAAAAAALLWDTWLSDKVKRELAELLDGDEIEVRTLATWLAGIHDVGKCSPDFSVQALKAHGSAAQRSDYSALVAHERDAGLEIPLLMGPKIGHATVGQRIAERWLRSVWGFSRPVAKSYVSVIGGHHGINPALRELQRVDACPDQAGQGRWAEVQEEILTHMAHQTGAVSYLPAWSTKRLPVPAQVLLLGLVVLADWMASNEDLFPYSDARPAKERAATAAAALGLPAPWHPDEQNAPFGELFHTRFPRLAEVEPRPVQRALAGAFAASKTPALAIVEAPMGEGKTEAAFLASEIAAQRLGCGGLYIGMPTMATADPMFARMMDWLEHAAGASATSVNLAHGRAQLNETFRALLRQEWRFRVYDEDVAGSPPSARVASWLRGRRRSTLANHVVGTVDQGLFLALKAKHVALRHLSLAGKVVVIDEVHAADDYMRVYLRRMLTWLGAYGAPTILMSATLPPAQRDEFVRAYAAGSGADVHPTASDDRYPRITLVTDTVTDIPVEPSADSRVVAFSTLPDDLESLTRALEQRLADGGCAGVICNTVGRAQESYAALKSAFGADVVLLHSRFIAPHRAARESATVAELGPYAGNARPARRIVVGTQVLEQSLDIDFDVLVTDLAPVDLVLQRVGRLHRHGGRARPESVSLPACLVRGMEDPESAPPRFARGSVSVYGVDRLLRARAVLTEALGGAPVRIPADVPRLVRLAYDPDLSAPAGWEDAWRHAETTDGRQRALALSRASTYLLDEPADLSSLDGWPGVSLPDPERSERQGRSQVRDSDDSLEVLALWRGTDGILRLPREVDPDQRPIPEHTMWTPADEPLAALMARCTLRLPTSLTRGETGFNQVITSLEHQVRYDGWQASPWLAGQLAVVFDEFGESHVGTHLLHYDHEIGLTVDSIEDTPS